MIRQIAPQFFTTTLPATIAHYNDRLGFECVGTWHDPPVYAIVVPDEQRIHFRVGHRPSPILTIRRRLLEALPAHRAR